MAAWLNGHGKRNLQRRNALLGSLVRTLAVRPARAPSPARQSAVSSPDAQPMQALAAQLKRHGVVSLDHLLSMPPGLLLRARQPCLSGTDYRVRARGQVVNGDEGEGPNVPRRQQRVALPVPVSEDEAVAAMGAAGFALRTYLCKCEKPTPCEVRLVDSSTVPAKTSLTGQMRHADHKREGELVVVVICTGLGEHVTTRFAVGSHLEPLFDHSRPSIGTPLTQLDPPAMCAAFDARVSHAAAPSDATRVHPGRWFLSFVSECLPLKKLKAVLKSNYSSAAATRYDAAVKLGRDAARSCLEVERNQLRGGPAADMV